MGNLDLPTLAIDYAFLVALELYILHNLMHVVNTNSSHLGK